MKKFNIPTNLLFLKRHKKIQKKYSNPNPENLLVKISNSFSTFISESS